MAFPSANLAGYWRLDESSGNAVDVLGINTLTNTNTVTYSASKLNNGANFASASSQYLIKSSPTGLPSGTGAYSVSLWMKAASWIGDSGLFTWGTNSTNQQNLIKSDSSTTFAVYNGSSYSFTVPTMSTGTWYHIVVTCAGSGSPIIGYFNGAYNATTANVTYNTGSTFVQLGSAFGGDYSHWNGSLDEVGIWSRALTSTEVTTLYNAGNGLAPDLQTSLVSYYKCDESSGNAADSVGSNTLTNTNVTYSAGKLGNGAVFNGSSAILTGASAFQTGSGDFSLSTWFKTTTTGAIKEIITTGTGGTGTAYYLNLLSDNKISFEFYGTTQIKSLATKNDGNWHHVSVVGIASTKTYSMYIDGVYNSAATIGTVWNLGTGVGKVGWAGSAGRYFDGMIDEVAIYSRALSSTEVAALYNDGLGTQYPFSEMKSGKVEVVAGGGGGGYDLGGGGGAGGYQYNSAYPLSAQAYSVTVGTGGAGSTADAANGTSGNNSVFSTITSLGGGGGSSRSGAAAPTGGSGGGGSYNGKAPGNGTTGQGNNGGTSPSGVNGTGGGGGASAVGGNGSGATAGAGGAGIASAIQAATIGQNSSGTYYLAGGGGGTNSSGTTGSNGGLGGGGAGATYNGVDAVAGTANTGGGGGGGGGGPTTQLLGGGGGSGVVIVSVLTSDFSVSSTGTLNVDYKTGTSGSETWIAFLTSQTLTLGTPSTVNSGAFFSFF